MWSSCKGTAVAGLTGDRELKDIKFNQEEQKPQDRKQKLVDGKFARAGTLSGKEPFKLLLLFRHIKIPCPMQQNLRDVRFSWTNSPMRRICSDCLQRLMLILLKMWVNLPQNLDTLTSSSPVLVPIFQITPRYMCI